MSRVDDETEPTHGGVHVENENTTPVGAESAVVETSDVAATEPTVQVEETKTVETVEITPAVAEAIAAVAPKSGSRRQSNTMSLKTLLANATAALGDEDVAKMFVEFI